MLSARVNLTVCKRCWKGGNIKLSNVVSAINSKSSRNLLQNVREFLRFFSLSTKVLTLINDKVLSM